MADLFDLSSLDDPVNVGGRKIPKIALFAGGVGLVAVFVLLSKRGGGGGSSLPTAKQPVAPQGSLGLGSGLDFGTPGLSIEDVRQEISNALTEKAAPVESAPAAETKPTFVVAPRLTKLLKRQVYRLGNPTGALPDVEGTGLRYAPVLSKRYGFRVYVPNLAAPKPPLRTAPNNLPVKIPFLPVETPKTPIAPRSPVHTVAVKGQDQRRRA